MVSRKIWAVIALLAMLPAAAAARSSFDETILPQNARSLAYAIGKDYHAARQSTYVLAIGANGRGWGSADAPGWNVQDRIRNALQKCEHYAKDACILLMRDGETTAESRPRARTLRYPAIFSPEDVPFINEPSRRALGKLLTNQAPHRAVALHRSGIWGAVYGRNTRQQAIDDALTRCRQEAHGDACFLYAVDEEVEFSPATSLRPD